MSRPAAAAMEASAFACTDSVPPYQPTAPRLAAAITTPVRSPGSPRRVSRKAPKQAMDQLCVGSHPKADATSGPRANSTRAA